jgi:hypothetical protein
VNRADDPVSTSPSPSNPQAPAAPSEFAWLPDEQPRIDLRINPWPIRDQQEPGLPRGACAAFAATALHELARADSRDVWLSELSLILTMEDGFAAGAVYLDDTFHVLHNQGQLSQTDYSALAGKTGGADLTWRKVRISATKRSPRNIEKHINHNRPVLLGLQQMVSLSQPDHRGVITITPDDEPEGNPGAPIGHAVVVVGKTTIGTTIHFLVRNSWGDDWARGGYALIDHNYVDRYGRDAAVVETVID